MKWLFDPASVQGVAMAGDWYVFIVAGIAVGIYVYVAILWCVFRYRRRGGEAQRFEKNTPLELTYTIVPLLIVLGLFAKTFLVERPVDNVASDPQEKVAVTAFRWSWQFSYLGSNVKTIGTPRRPPTLYLPLGRLVEFDLTTADVNHSFWVPAFLFKRDAIPGMTNVFDITPSRTGTFVGRCAQYCGLDHAYMTFAVQVVPAAAFDRYIASNGTAVP
ncbi:MAG TPA: cytochrome c oxidase subunit II [Candidatus Baltobacteraceae bacterium]|nr:cytochrome c oxidase subunit II [Candidatus Baltobacteraceae bacterium]